ncbi:MAG: hypothetical protein ACF8PN_06750 [Phycisphaerales bacterium]
MAKRPKKKSDRDDRVAHVTIRMNRELVRALRLAATDRKFDEQPPFTQTDIVVEAVEQLLTEWGYWPPD